MRYLIYLLLVTGCFAQSQLVVSSGPKPLVDVTAPLYGAKGDGTDNTVGGMTSGSAVVTNGGMTCPAVAGMSMYMAGAGAAGVGLVGTLSCPGNVKTLSVAASTTVTNAFTIWGTDNTTAFNTAFAANPEVWIPCANANSYYAVFSTVGLGTSGVKANVHKIHGGGGYENRTPVNGCVTQIAWGGLDGGTVFSFDGTTHAILDNLAIDGKSHAGIGLLETTSNAVQSTHRNVYSNITISSIMGSPGYAVSVSGNFHSANQDVCCSFFEHISVAGGFFQHNTATGTVGTCYEQDGTQTTLVTLTDFSCADFTSRGLDAEGGMVYVRGMSFSSKQSGSNIDSVYIANNVLASQLIDVYDEVTTTSDCATRHSVNLPSGSRTYPTTFTNLRTYWGPTCTSGAAIATAQAGNVTLLGGSIEATSGTVTSTFAQTGSGVVTLDGTYFQPSHSVYTSTGPVNLPINTSAIPGLTMSGALNLANQSMLQSATNCASGTVTAKLVKWSSAAGVPCLTVAATTDTNTAIGICVNACGNSGTGQYASIGVNASCVFDGATTVNDFVIISPTVTGDCHDSGSATVAPTTTEVIGRVQSTNGGGGSYGVNVGASLDIVGGGGSGNVPAMSSATQGATLTNNASVAKWSRQVFDVAAGYGADPTGVADSASAIASAISACGSAGGGAILFPPGTYIHSSQIVLNQNNCYFVGNNRSATLKKNYNSTSVAAVVIAASHVGIIGMTYDGNQASFTGNCIQDNSANTDILVQNNLIINCNGNNLFFTAASGATAADHVNVFDNTIICGTGTAANFGALGFQQTVHDVIVRNNVLDCSNDTSTAGVGAIQAESQGLVTKLSNFLIEGNTILTPNPASSQGWGIQFGAFNAYSTHNIQIVSNRITISGDNTACMSLVAGTAYAVTNNICDINGHNPKYVAYELISISNSNIVGNVANFDFPGNGTIPLACFALSSFSLSTFTGNTCNGFGENAGQGIIVNITQLGQQALTACSETGNVATFTTSGASSSAFEPGAAVFLTGNTPSGYNTTGTPLVIIDANYVRTAGTFSVQLPTTGLGACSGFGFVQSSSSNNTIADNVINFPQGDGNNLTGSRYGIWLRGTLTGGHTDNNLIIGNTINGFASTNETGINIGGTGTNDGNVVSNNHLNNLAVGITVGSGTTNVYIGNNPGNAVTTLLTDGGTANLINSGLPIAFGKLATCAAGLEGNTAVLTDVTTATWNTTVVGGGSNHLRAGCNATNWVTQ